MASANDGNSSGGAGFIRPAKPDLTARSAPAGTAARPPLPRSRILFFAGIAVLVVAVAVVVIFLPSWVPAPSVAAPSAPASPPGPAPSGPTAPAVQPAPADAPWQRAQQLEQRRRTQEVLEQMLEAQKELGAKGAATWASAEYAEAQQHATAGDTHYGAQDYAAALQEYTEAQRMMAALVERIEPLFEKSMADGAQALEAGNAAAAAAAFDVALAIDSLDRAAVTGRARAGTLDQVMPIVREADDLLREERFDEAGAAYQRALEIDPETAAAKAGMDAVATAVRDRDFNRAMSEGFAALDQGRLDDASRAFAGARKIKPDSREAGSGLEQAAAGIKARKIQALLAEAGKQEAAENWRGAQSSYEAALALDPALAAAIQGQQAMSTRAGVSERLEQVLANPKSLYKPEFFKEVSALRDNLRRMSAPWASLQRQLDVLDGALAKAATPVEVQFVSDNLTRVTVYRVGDLGTFASRSLSMRPGQYVAVGTRDGYQDARIEFSVDPDVPPAAVTVQADRKIGAGS